MALLINILLVVIASCVARLGFILVRRDKAEAERNASRTPKFWDALMGRAHISNDWLPDARVQGGMVFNKKAKRIEVCGKISDDSLDRTFR